MLECFFQPNFGREGFLALLLRRVRLCHPLHIRMASRLVESRDGGVGHSFPIILEDNPNWKLYWLLLRSIQSHIYLITKETDYPSLDNRRGKGKGRFSRGSIAPCWVVAVQVSCEER